MNVIWITCVMTVISTTLLRLSGRRSISQMTFGSVAVMLALGAVIAEPIAQKNVWLTVIIAAVMLATVAVLEWLQLHSDWLERLITGKSLVVIDDGQIVQGNLKRLRLTVDKLEMRLRQHGIKRITDVKTATMEVNGALGYELQPDKEPLTVGQFEQMMRQFGISFDSKSVRTNQPTLFDEPKRYHNKDSEDQGQLQ